MPKFRVVIIETRELVHAEIEADNAEIAGELAKGIEPSGITVKDRKVGSADRILNPEEMVYKFQIDNIRRDYDSVSNGKLPDGKDVDPDTAKTIMEHLAKQHDNLIATSKLDIPTIAEAAAAASGSATIKTPVNIDNPQEVWEKCATAFGWEYDSDYKGWIKKANRAPGKIHGEWDAYQRDMTAEDACNEEGIDSVEEAAQALSAEALS